MFIIIAATTKPPMLSPLNATNPIGRTQPYHRTQTAVPLAGETTNVQKHYYQQKQIPQHQQLQMLLQQQQQQHQQQMQQQQLKQQLKQEQQQLLQMQMQQQQKVEPMPQQSEQTNQPEQSQQQPDNNAGSATTTPTTIDINTLREKSKNLDLPLISALCNDRSLLKQTKAFVMPKHPRSPITQSLITSPKSKYPVSGLTTNQLAKPRKSSISHRHPNDKLPPIPMHTTAAEGNNYVMDPTPTAIKHKSYNSQPNL